MIAFDIWQSRGKGIHLLLPDSVKNHPSPSQLEIIRKVEASGGKLVNTDSCATAEDPDLTLMMDLSQRIPDHGVGERSSDFFDKIQDTRSEPDSGVPVGSLDKTEQWLLLYW